MNNTYSGNYLKSAHDAARYNRQALSSSKSCGCFYCLKIFSPARIMEWIPEEEDGDEVTALCPYCGIDSVLPETSVFPITEDFLKPINEM